MKRWFLIVLPILLFAVALRLVCRPALRALGDYLVVRDELHSADVIHVISGPNWRVDRGIQLYLVGYGRQLFFTGRTPQAERARERAIRRGVPPSAVVSDGSYVNSTYSEAVRLRAFIDASEEPVRSVILVSDAYHMRRSRWAYRHALGDQVTLQMAPVSLRDASYRSNWWTHPRSASMVASEYAKMAYYFFRYGLAYEPLSTFLAAVDVF
jgi:uncharacterized SAM-binding protein YcdF (DUF218 family)